jgi:hypothetical protein
MTASIYFIRRYQPIGRTEHKSSDTMNRRKIEDEKQKSISSAMSVGRIGASIALGQLEGGEELQDSSAVAGLALHPCLGAASKGRKLYRQEAQRNQRAKRLKRVKTKSGIKNYTGKSIVKSDIRISGNRNLKETAKARRKAFGYRGKQLEIKKSTRDRMLNYFINKTKQNENRDSFSTVIKDIVLMRISVVARNLAVYIGGSLLALVLLMAVVAVPVMLIIAALYHSPVAIFLPSLEEGDTVKSVTNRYVQEFNQEISNLAYSHVGYDEGSISYTTTVTDNFYDIIVVYMVKYGVGDAASVMNDTNKERLKEVFDLMYSYSTSVVTYTVVNEDETTTTRSILCVNIMKQSYLDMISIYGFDTEEAQLLDEMMKAENLALLR